MKWIMFICLSVVIAGLIISGCSSSEEKTSIPDTKATTPAVNMVTPPTIDWSQIKSPEVGEEGNWMLTEEAAFMLGAMFSPGAETIFGYGSNTHLLLIVY